jgi:hypothetical protein
VFTCIQKVAIQKYPYGKWHHPGPGFRIEGHVPNQVGRKVATPTKTGINKFIITDISDFYLL